MDSPEPLILDESSLISLALACRPDYQAARWSIAAAADRSRLARWLFLKLDGVLDVRNDPAYSRTGGGLRAVIPIFDRNQGGIMRADWEVNAACHARDAIHDQIVADVRVATRQFRLARDNLQILQQDVASALAEALKISQKGFADGGTDYLLVFDSIAVRRT